MFFQQFVYGFLSENALALIMYVIIILIFFPLEAVALPKLYGKLFDNMKLGTGPDFWNIKENLSKLNLPGAILAVVLTWILIVISYGIKHHFEADLSPKYMSYVRKMLYEKTIEAFKENYTDVKTGVYLSRMLELMRNAKELFQYILNTAFPYLIAVMFTVGYVMFKDIKLGQILLLTFIICGIINYIGGNKLIGMVAERETYMNEVVNQGIQNSVDNLMNIYINNESNNEINKNHEEENEGRKKMSEIMFTQNLVISISHLMVIAGYGVGMYYIYNMLHKKKYTISEAIVFVLILGQFVSFNIDLNAGYIHGVIYKLGIIMSAEPFLEEIFVKNSKRVKKDFIKKGDIEFKDIVFRYDSESDDVLYDGLNLSIKGGTSVGVVGRSGSGKSTLMKMLIGLYKPEEGQILIDNVDINKANIEYLRSEVNYVNQNTKLFEDTIINNMLYGNDHISEEQVVSKLKKYRLDELFSELPEGIYANAGLAGGNLSGGMQKLTILIRGILKKGTIVILDEPLAGLDQKTISKVINLIVDELQNKTSLIITHDKTILPYLDRVVDINKL